MYLLGSNRVFKKEKFSKIVRMGFDGVNTLSLERKLEYRL